MALGQQTHRLDGVDVVVGGAGAQHRLEQHFGLEHVGRTGDDLLGCQADALAVVVHRISDLDQHLLEGRLRHGGGGVQLVAERAVDDGVRGAHQRHTVTTCVRTVEGAVQDVGGQRFLRLNQRLRQVLGVGLTDTDVVTVLDQHLRQREGQAVHLVQVALQEQHATGLVGHGHAVRQLGRRPEAVQDGLFVVVARDAFLLAEDLLPLVSTLLVNAVEHLVQNRLNNGTEVRTTHWGCHGSALLIPS